MRADAHAAQAAERVFGAFRSGCQREHHDRGETGPPSSREHGREQRHGTSESIRRFGRSVEVSTRRDDPLHAFEIILVERAQVRV
jgi:hypothetical protein